LFLAKKRHMGREREHLCIVGPLDTFD
jgi:hypothetical protein